MFLLINVLIIGQAFAIPMPKIDSKASGSPDWSYDGMNGKSMTKKLAKSNKSISRNFFFLLNIFHKNFHKMENIQKKSVKLIKISFEEFLVWTFFNFLVRIMNLIEFFSRIRQFNFFSDGPIMSKGSLQISTILDHWRLDLMLPL